MNWPAIVIISNEWKRIPLEHIFLFLASQKPHRARWSFHVSLEREAKLFFPEGTFLFQPIWTISIYSSLWSRTLSSELTILYKFRQGSQEFYLKMICLIQHGATYGYSSLWNHHRSLDIGAKLFFPRETYIF